MQVAPIVRPATAPPTGSHERLACHRRKRPPNSSACARISLTESRAKWTCTTSTASAVAAASARTGRTRRVAKAKKQTSESAPSSAFAFTMSDVPPSHCAAASVSGKKCWNCT